jgi:hypothetical protein
LLFLELLPQQGLPVMLTADFAAADIFCTILTTVTIVSFKMTDLSAPKFLVAD